MFDIEQEASIGRIDVLNLLCLRTPKQTLSSQALEQLKQQLRCFLCKEYISIPVYAKNCLHRFCKNCIDPLIRLQKRQCPICKSAIGNHRQLIQDVQLLNLIDTLFDLGSQVPRTKRQRVETPECQKVETLEPVRKRVRIQSQTVLSQDLKCKISRLMSDIQNKIGIQCSLHLHVHPAAALVPQISAQKILVPDINKKMQIIAQFILCELGLSDQAIELIQLFVRSEGDYRKVSKESSVKQVILESWPGSKVDFQPFKGGIQRQHQPRVIYYGVNFGNLSI